METIDKVLKSILQQSNLIIFYASQWLIVVFDCCSPNLVTFCINHLI